MMSKPDILQKIVQKKKEEVEAAKRKIPENEMRDAAEKPREHRSFFGKLRTPGPSGVNIISEIKRASPSKGVIRADLDPAVYARAYENGGAACISVLTDQPFFHGSFDDLKTAKSSCSLPILRKDFIVSPYQVYETAAIGADAMLLIVRILTEEELADFLELAESLGLDVLTEVHSREEIDIVLKTKAQLIGINNRNLKSFETNIETAINMVKLLESHHVPVAESGVHSRDDILKLQSAGIFNYLIGESIVRADDPSAFLKHLHSGQAADR